MFSVLLPAPSLPRSLLISPHAHCCSVFFFCRLQQHQSHKRSFQRCLLVSNVLRYPWSQQSVVTAGRGFSHPVKVLKSTAFSHSRTQLQVPEQVVASCLHLALWIHMELILFRALEGAPWQVEQKETLARGFCALQSPGGYQDLSQPGVPGQ